MYFFYYIGSGLVHPLQKKLRVVVEQQTTPKVSVKHNNIGSSPVASGYVVDQTQFCVKIREQYFIQDGRT